MIHLFVGTKAQLIKLAPVMLELRDRDIPFRYIDSGQHAHLTRGLRREFGLPEPDTVLSGRRDNIASVTAAAAWYARILIRGALRRRHLRRTVFPGGGICLIHGDTASTLMGLQLARAAGLDVAHVEAGLRSHRVSSPFPEELIRNYCARRSQLLFAPSDEAVRNLERMRVPGRIEPLVANTVADSLRIIASRPPAVAIPPEPFALVTCHRLETIARRGRLLRVVELVNRVAERLRVVFVLHEPTRRALRRLGPAGRLDARVDQRGLLGYGDFLGLLRAARMVLSDGGSIQEECAYLDKPCLILRRDTERNDGLGQNALLWRFDERVAGRFLSIADHPPAPIDGLPRVSAAVVDVLIRSGYSGGAARYFSTASRVTCV